MQLCLHTTYTLHPGHVANFLELVVPLRQNAAREPKCQYYNAFTSGEEGSGVVRVVEIWDSQPDYVQYVQRKLADIQSFQQQAEAYSVRPQVLEAWNPVDGFKHVRRG